MMESGTDGASRDAEHFGDLGGLQARVMSKHEERSLLGRQTPEAALQLVAVADTEIAVFGHGDVKWKRLDVHGDASALPGRLVDTGAHDDAMQPGVEAVGVSETGQVTPGDDQRFLHSILSSLDIAEDPLRDRVEPIATDADQVGIGLPISHPCGFHEIAIHNVVL